MWAPNRAAVLESWSDQGLVGAALDVWVIDFKVSLQKAKLLISLCCSLFSVGFPCYVVCYIVTPRYFIRVRNTMCPIALI